MDMISYALRLQFITQLHGLVRNGKGCMHTHHSCEHIAVVCQCVFDKVYVFHNGFSGFVHAVTVGNLIAETGTNAQILCRFLNGT